MKTPNIFYDEDKDSKTYNTWCVRIDEGSSIDGFTSVVEAAHYCRTGEFLCGKPKNT
jgi:hypothetical protein